MDAATVSLTVGILTFVVGISSAIIAWRRFKHEAPNMDADAFAKFQETLTKLQERNDALYAENVTLQVKVTDTERTNQNLTIRLEERDAQLSAATKQLDLLRELARTAPVTDTLKAQLETMSRVVDGMQTAQSELQQMLKDREKAYRELFDSTRIKPKPAS